MDQKWNNARHCAAALKSLLDHLSNQYRDMSKQLAVDKSIPSAPGASAMQRKRMPDGTIDHQAGDLSQRSAKRANHGTPTAPHGSNNNDVSQLLAQNQHDSESQLSAAQAPPLDLSTNIPVTDSTSTAFGDINQQYSQGDDGDFLSLPTAAEFYGNVDGGFGNIEWESMVNNWSSFHDWGSWDMPESWDQ